MNVEQLLLQLGVSGAIIWAVVKLGLRFIDRWTVSEDKKTEILATNLSDITKSVSGVHISQARIETKLDTAMGLTPVHGTPLVEADDADTNPESPHAIEAQSAPRQPYPRATTQGGLYHLNKPARSRRQ